VSVSYIAYQVPGQALQKASMYRPLSPKLWNASPLCVLNRQAAGLNPREEVAVQITNILLVARDGIGHGQGVDNTHVIDSANGQKG